ncbi:MAG: sigma-70 family RNA polymerase sigma factor [Hyphomonadaceae bacterium]|nr:sigma-70 family RNA polymerase sigma factor [Hyphomonadaceae bacterium]
MIDDRDLSVWFKTSVLPHEAALTRFIRKSWPNTSDIADIRQDVYERILTGAQANGLPQQVKAYLFVVARNLLINRARRAKIVAFDLVADLESLLADGEIFETERQFVARQELLKAREGLERLPPRCREVIRLRKFEELSTRDVAERMGVTEHTVERQLTLGIRALTDFMLGGEGRVVRKKGSRRLTREGEK